VAKAARLQIETPTLSDIDVFLKIVTEAASVASYDPIQPENLRVWVTGAPKDHPEEWPQIKTVNCPGKWIEGL
jgi:hypothetical protein